MADEEATIYREKVSEVVEVPGADDLVQSRAVPSEIKVSIGGVYKRGELMMSNGDNEFMTATAAGLAGAQEVCILCRDCDIPNGQTLFTAGYFSGTFNADKVILSYESEGDDHAELIEAVKVSLRRRAIYFN